MPFGSINIMPGENDWERIFGRDPYGRVPGAFQPPKAGGLLGRLDNPLTQIGLGILGASSPQGSFGQGLSSGVLGYQQQRKQTQEDEIKRRLTEAQIRNYDEANRKPLAVIGPDGKPTYVAENDAIGQTPYSLNGQAEPPARMQEWLQDNKDRAAVGLKPRPYLDFVTEVSKRSVGAQYTQTTQGGVPGAFSRTGGGFTPTGTLDAETDAARQLSEAKARGAAYGKISGELTGGILKKGTDAVGAKAMLSTADALIDVATGSAPGAARDAVAGFFGFTPEPAEAIGSLQILQANLMMNQPRMEGPQGVLDVKLYEKMAGQIGDPMVPAGKKKAALREIIRLQDKYIERATDAGMSPLAPPRPGAAPKRIRVDAQGNVIGG
jgi:hypothetical protein